MRRSWRFMSAFGMFLAAMSIGFTAWVFLYVQTSRRDALITTCLETNRRHDATIAALDDLIAAVPDGPRKVRAQQSRAGTVLLIEALAPYVADCDGRATRLTK